MVVDFSLAECPEGKSELLIVTPSGKENLICVPDEAIPGLENASEHSATSIVTAPCPCWTQSDLDKWAEDAARFFCEDPNGIECLNNAICPHYKCYLDAGLAASIGMYHPGEDLACKNYVTDNLVRNISLDEYDSCLTIMESYGDKP